MIRWGRGEGAGGHWLLRPISALLSPDHLGPCDFHGTGISFVCHQLPQVALCVLNLFPGSMPQPHPLCIESLAGTSLAHGHLLSQGLVPQTDSTQRSCCECSKPGSVKSWPHSSLTNFKCSIISLGPTSEAVPIGKVT